MSVYVLFEVPGWLRSGMVRVVLLAFDTLRDGRVGFLESKSSSSLFSSLVYKGFVWFALVSF